MTFEEFIDNYRKYGKTINQVQPSQKKLNQKQLEKLYDKYQKQYLKEHPLKIDEKMEIVYGEIDKRDECQCQLICKISTEDLYTLSSNAPTFLLQKIDHAHVFGRGAFPFMKHMPDNIVLLNRYSHSLIDQYRNPINGQPIDYEEHKDWWVYIIGEERYRRLKAVVKTWGNSDNG